jgi:hypothetical protein
MNAMFERRSAALLSCALLTVTLAACTPPGGPPRAPEPSGEGAVQDPQTASAQQGLSSAGSPGASSPANAGGGADPATAPGALLPVVGLEDPAGELSKAPDAAFAPLRDRMRECAAGRSGVVRVRIKNEKNRTSMDIEPGSSVDGSNRCVLEALSTVDVDDALSRSSPSNRASGFTSVVRIEW